MSAWIGLLQMKGGSMVSQGPVFGTYRFLDQTMGRSLSIPILLGAKVNITDALNHTG